MPAHITMTLYTGIVLECEHCYRICRWSEAMVRRNCPSCGLEIGNWQALTNEVTKHEAPDDEAPHA